ncbi:MAG: hypothetical protein GYB31_16450 [Bacteroidetes bacterium]|nr:hypothetical protein [Bacteroidota bacterium]
MRNTILTKLRLLPLFICMLFLPQLACTPASSNKPILEAKKICGLNLVAPPQPFPNNPMVPIQAVEANWIAVCPFGFTRQGSNQVHYNSNRQWWGERPEGVRESVRLAHEAGIQVLLKPHVYIPGSWPGDLSFSAKADWENWEKDYSAYILEFAKLAEELQVEMFSIGVEFKKSVVPREAFWRGLIDTVRQVYSGPLTYAANWDEFDRVPFWDALDYIGVDAYFPLVNHETPSVRSLKKAWRPYIRQLKDIHNKTDKPILFTEYGYLSVDGCAYNTWELESRVHDLSLNEQAQANAIDALFSSFWNEAWWHGGFIWKWFPNMQGHEGYPAKDYTPQNKMGEDVLRKWHSRSI